MRRPISPRYHPKTSLFSETAHEQTQLKHDVVPDARLLNLSCPGEVIGSKYKNGKIELIDRSDQIIKRTLAQIEYAFIPTVTVASCGSRLCLIASAVSSCSEEEPINTVGFGIAYYSFDFNLAAAYRAKPRSSAHI